MFFVRFHLNNNNNNPILISYLYIRNNYFPHPNSKLKDYSQILLINYHYVFFFSNTILQIICFKRLQT